MFLTGWDLGRLSAGTHYRSYESLGAHPATLDGQNGVRFAVWAPNAAAVSVIGDFNEWDASRHPMRNRGPAGIWECFVGGAGDGNLYKYAVTPRLQRHPLDKADPYAFAAEVAPGTASKVCSLDGYSWGDSDWMRGRAARHRRSAPLAIYEVHLGSWMRVPEEGDRWLGYGELADRLSEHVLHCGFTHVELLPVTEHPFGGSWGYQTTAYFAPTGRYGAPRDFMAFVDALHRRGIGVILDWSAAHFPDDAHALARFDGTHLYEHEDPRLGRHPHWDSLIFNYGRSEVANFLVSSALFWLDKYHIDGIRVDAVASMLYLDYGREDGQWVPNRRGGKENLQAIDFLKVLNEEIHARFPDVLTVAEESTTWPGVSRPVSEGGLGFSLKWNMGWMHDTLEYMGTDPVFRKHHHECLTFGLTYAFEEHFVLPLSHDEVVHMKGSLLEKMAGDDWQKFASLRLLYTYMYAYPGKKLLFMGSEFGQRLEWNHDRSLDWHVLQALPHGGLQRLVADLNRLYRETPALHEGDSERGGFAWIDCSDRDAGVISFLRMAGDSGQMVLVVCHFTPLARSGYRVGVPRPGTWAERLNSDSGHYGGGNFGNGGAVEADDVPMHGCRYSLELALPPLAALVLEPAGPPGADRTSA